MHNYFKVSMSGLLLLIFLVSLLFVFPNLFGYAKNLSSDRYTPFALTDVSIGVTVDEFYYAMGINQASYGKPVHDFVTYENRNLLSTKSILGTVVFGKLSSVVGIERLYVVSHAIFPAIVFILLYLQLNLITKNNLLSAFGSLAFLAFESLPMAIYKIGASLKSGNIDHLKAFYGGLTNRYLDFMRFDVPLFSFTMLLIALITLWLGFKRKTHLFFLVSGILWALQLYIYFYYSLFSFFFLTIFFLLYLFKNRFSALKQAIIFVIGYVPVSLPFIFNFLSFQKLPQSLDYMYRLGRLDGRWFDKQSIYPVLLLIVVIIIGKRNPKTQMAEILFTSSVLLALFGSYNWQLISGFTVQHGHFYSMIGQPFVLVVEIFVLSRLISLFIKKFNKHRDKLEWIISRILLILIVVMFIFAYAKHIFTIANTYTSYTLKSDISDSFMWLNQNTSKNDVVMTPSYLSNYRLLLYTHNYVFMPVLGTLSPTDENVERAAITFKKFSVPYSYSTTFISYVNFLTPQHYTEESFDLNGMYNLFTLKYLKDNFKIPEEDKNKYLELFLNPGYKTFKEIKEKYKVDYLYFGPYEKRLTEADLQDDPELCLAYSNSKVKIFKICETEYEI